MSGVVTVASDSALKRNWRHLVHVLSANPLTLVAFALLVVLLLIALAGPSLVPFSPLASNAADGP